VLQGLAASKFKVTDAATLSRGTRTQCTVKPSRQAFCASAHDNSDDLPTPHDPVTRRLRCSTIQRPAAIC
jgi:hypothetical protein